MDDGEASIREASAEAMGNLMKLVSEKSLYPFIEKLDKIKEAKVKDYYKNASDSHNPVPMVLTKSVKSVLKPQSSVSKKIVAKDEKVKHLTINSDVISDTFSNVKSDLVKFGYTNESALDCVLHSSLAENVESVKDTNWKIRLEGKLAQLSSST